MSLEMGRDLLYVRDGKFYDYDGRVPTLSYFELHATIKWVAASNFVVEGITKFSAKIEKRQYVPYEIYKTNIQNLQKSIASCRFETNIVKSEEKKKDSPLFGKEDMRRQLQDNLQIMEKTLKSLTSLDAQVSEVELQKQRTDRCLIAVNAIMLFLLLV